MIGLVIVTHGALAQEFVRALEHVVGKQTHIQTISIGPDDNMEKRRADIVAAVKSVELGDGVIVLTDMFGGTPSNLSISMLEREKVEVIAGINLPMLIKLASVRVNGTLEKAVREAQDAGRKYIRIASQELASGR